MTDIFSEENKIFITKLTQICKDHDRNLSDVHHIKNTLSQKIEPGLDTFKSYQQTSAQRLDMLESKLSTIEKHIPLMIEQIVHMGVDKRITEKLQNYAQSSDVSALLKDKLSAAIFYDF